MNSETQQREDLVVYDFSKVEPAGALGRDLHWQEWHLVPWESDMASGQALWAYHDRVPALSMGLEAEGWYAISVGLWSPPYTSTRIRLRLSGEEPWDELWARNPCQWINREDFSISPYFFEEHFWRLVDLRGQNLEIAGTESKTGLAFVRLIPLTEAQVEAVGDSRRVPWIWLMDGFSPLACSADPPSRAVTDDIDGFAGTDFVELSWNIGGPDLVNYDTRVGTRYGAAGGPYVNETYYETVARNVERLMEAGQDPAAIATERTREYEMKLWLALRLQAFMIEHPFDSMFDSPFRVDHPQWACVTRDGGRLMQMSYAFPEVRRQAIEILLEVLPNRPEGLHLIINRGVPCTYFEKPVVDEFQRLHRADIRNLPVLDPRVVEFRAQYLNTFLRELRQAMDGGGYAGVKLAVNCFQNRRINDEFGLDVAGWAREGLVDRLMVFRWEWRWNESCDMPFWREVVRGTDCELFLFAYNGNQDAGCLPQEHRQRALELIRAGAEGLCAWDGPPYLGTLNLGRPGELEVWEEVSRPLPQARIRKVRDMVVDECPPIWGF